MSFLENMALWAIKALTPTIARMVEGRFPSSGTFVVFAPASSEEALGQTLEKKPDLGSAFFSEKAWLVYHETGFVINNRPWGMRVYPLQGALTEVLGEADRLRRITKPIWYKKSLQGDLEVPPQWGYDKACSYLVLQVTPTQFQLLQQLVGLRSRIYNLDGPTDPIVELPLHEVRIVGPRGDGVTLHGAGHRTNSFTTITTRGWFGEFMSEHIAPMEYVPLIAGLIQGAGLLSRQQLPATLQAIWQEAITVDYTST